MTKLRFLELFLLLLTCELATCDISKVNCRMSERNRKCTIDNLMVTSKNYTFLPVASNPFAILKFEMVKSSVPVLTSNICTTFRRLTSFIANDQHIEIVEDFAFYNCSNLVEVILEGNVIHKFGKGVFSNTVKLQRLHILGGSLQHIDDDLLNNLSGLNQLLFGGIGLKELSLSAVRNLKNLQTLIIYSNDLSDMDAKQLTDQLPALTAVSLNDNNFHCDRLIEMLEIFASRNVTVSDYTYSKYMKKRDYVPRRVKNIICLSQAQQETENLKKALTSSLDDLKDYPLGKTINQLKDVVTAGFIDSDTEIVALSTSFNETTGSLKNEIVALSSSFNEATGSLKNEIVGLSSSFNETTGSLKNEIVALSSSFNETKGSLKNEIVALSTSFSETTGSLKNEIVALSSSFNETTGSLKNEIVSLSSSFNEKTDSLRNEIGSLNETLQGMALVLKSTSINASGSVVKNDLVTFQQKFEEKFNDIAELMRRNEESMDRSLLAIWVCLAVVTCFTILITVSLICYGYKKFQYLNKVVYSDGISLTQNNFD